MGKQKPKSILENAVQGGIKMIIKNHPRFENFQNYLIKHIDEEKIEEKFKELYEEAKEKKIKGEQIPQFLYEELRDYIASGSMLDERGKEVILKNTEEKPKSILENIASFFGYRSSKDEGERYLHNTMGAFQDLYALFESGDYSKRMPELTKSVSTLYDLKFLDPALDVLKSYGLIDERKYEFLKENIYQRVGKESENVVKGIEKYIVPQKIAASIFGLFGLGMIIFNLSLTGAVIETSTKLTNNIVGAILILVSMILLLIQKR